MDDLKVKAFDIFKNLVEKNIEDLTRHVQSSQKDANEASHAMQSRYDTFREEAQALKAGLEINLEKSRALLTLLNSIRNECLKILNTITAGAILKLRDLDTSEESYFYVIPGGSGKKIEIDGITYTCISPSAPLGKKILRKEIGDVIELTDPDTGIIKEFEVSNVI